MAGQDVYSDADRLPRKPAPWNWTGYWKGCYIMQNVLLCISLALVSGLLMTRLMKRVGLPAVTGYLITGLLLGPYCIGKLGFAGIGFHSMEELEKLLDGVG